MGPRQALHFLTRPQSFQTHSSYHLGTGGCETGQEVGRNRVQMGLPYHSEGFKSCWKQGLRPRVPLFELRDGLQNQGPQVGGLLLADALNGQKGGAIRRLVGR